MLRKKPCKRPGLHRSWLQLLLPFCIELRNGQHRRQTLARLGCQETECGSVQAVEETDVEV